MLIELGRTDTPLNDTEARQLITAGLGSIDLTDKRVLAIIPDLTRIAPLPQMFPIIEELVRPIAACLDYLIALGTHRRDCTTNQQ